MIDEYRAKRFCKEDISKIENYDKAVNDKEITWHCHHRTEIWWNCSKKDLIKNECYYNRKACELIFLTPEEHVKLHHKNKIVSEETKQKMSKAQKGKPRSKESIKKRSETVKGRHLSEETKKKIAESRKKYFAKKKGEI